MKKMVIAFASVVLVAFVGISTASAETYEVEKGDSLWKIADKYDTTVDDLMDINDLETSVIQPEQKLAIYETYTVEKGDTLSEVAKEFGTKTDDLKDLNGLDSDIIAIDQELDINSTEGSEEASKSTDEKEKTNSEETKEENKSHSDEEKDDSKAEEQSESADDESPDGETLEVTATAYTADCDNCSGVTYTGVDLHEDPDAKVIAVDPDVIPLGSDVYVEDYGYATAADIGGAINGNRVDLFVPDESDALDWGKRTVDVTIVD